MSMNKNYLDEYRDPAIVKTLASAMQRLVTQPWTIMEVCGGQTHSIIKHALDQLLPDSVELVHGPGCPVCVTATEVIDHAITIAMRPEVIFTSFGDMLRVPGSHLSLLSARARGADVRVVYSPLDAVDIARQNPQREVVFLGVGFETTAPINAMAVHAAHREGLGNFSMLVSQVMVPPAIEAILAAPANRVQGFLAAGHVCAITGYEEYPRLAQQYRAPIVIAGFEPVDIMQGLLHCLRQLEAGEYRVENQYQRVVREKGNPQARGLMAEMFAVVDKRWRGLGLILQSGLALNERYRHYDAAVRFPAEIQLCADNEKCISGTILQGLAKPSACPAFGRECTPEHPLGATMVSSEGACAAYYQYRLPEETA
jgi:hydrogenase expression/formation protein HypD